jgi:hypothetical protein
VQKDRIDVYLIVFVPAVILLLWGLSDVLSPTSRILGAGLAVVGLVGCGYAFSGLKRFRRGAKHFPPPSPTHKSHKAHHKARK